MALASAVLAGAATTAGWTPPISSAGVASLTSAQAAASSAGIESAAGIGTSPARFVHQDLGLRLKILTQKSRSGPDVTSGCGARLTPGTSPHMPRGREDLARDCTGPPGRRRSGAVASCPDRPALNMRDMYLDLSTPTPCSPVIEPPWLMHSSRIAPDSSSAASAWAAIGVVEEHERVQVAVAGVEHVRDSQAGGGRQRADPVKHLVQRGARDDAVLHDVGGADPAHRGERGFAAAPDQRPLAGVGGLPDLERARRPWRSAARRRSRPRHRPAGRQARRSARRRRLAG